MVARAFGAAAPAGLVTSIEVANTGQNNLTVLYSISDCF